MNFISRSQFRVGNSPNKSIIAAIRHHHHHTQIQVFGMINKGSTTSHGGTSATGYYIIQRRD